MSPEIVIKTSDRTLNHSLVLTCHPLQEDIEAAWLLGSPKAADNVRVF